MLINCVICSDLFVAVDEVYGTSCGHLFHYLCLMQWIERSSSCPQCRTKTNQKNVHRIYFNILNNGTTEDPSVLQHRIDSLTFQLRMKDTDIKNANEKNELLNKQNKGLREEIKKLEGKVREEASNVAVLREQTQCLRKQTKEAEKAVNECKNLRKHVEFLQSVQSVVNGTTEDVEDMVNNCGVSLESVKSLATFVCVLRKEMKSATEEKRNLLKRVREVEHKLAVSSMEYKKLQNELDSQINAKLQLEKDLEHLEHERKRLLKKIKGLEEAMMSPSTSHPAESALRRLIAESPAPVDIQRPKLSDPGDDVLTLSLSCSSPVKSQAVNNKPSPYLNVKSSSIGLTPLRPSTSSNRLVSDKFSIFKKARMTTQMSSTSSTHDPETAYDGLGGHSKLDEFPKPSPKPQKLKKHVVGAVYKLKTKDIPSKTIKLDHFLDRNKSSTGTP
ncbi:E3 ubiquitin-protein ligase TRAIP [Anabrus simplex]|uniref:E3 ubiquitin-protein ligase TRAIP n=1 Tax=Anabrus simplex TaxID=316456 RepID=UPI0035A38F1E